MNDKQPTTPSLDPPSSPSSAASSREEIAQLERYAILWRGQTEPVCVGQSDGYWTPWHLAQASLAHLHEEIATVTKERDDLRAARRIHELDNHHNAALCPYCMPTLEADTRAKAQLRERAEKAEAEIARLTQELKVTDELLTDRQRVLDAVPPCPVHGSCVPHAVTWIEHAKNKPDV